MCIRDSFAGTHQQAAVRTARDGEFLRRGIFVGNEVFGRCDEIDVYKRQRLIRDSRYMFHTYTYATENYLCYAPSLHLSLIHI